MTQYNTLNGKLSHSQLNKLKSAIKIGTKETLNLSSNVVGDSNDIINSPHELLLTNTQISKICKAFANVSSANIKFSKTQPSKIIQSIELLGRLLGPLQKTALPLIENALKSLTKHVFSGFTKLIILNEEINDIMKIVKTLIGSGLLIKGVHETIKNEAKEQKGWFLEILLGTLDASLFWNLLIGKGTIRAVENF